MRAPTGDGQVFSASDPLCVLYSSHDILLCLYYDLSKEAIFRIERYVFVMFFTRTARFAEGTFIIVTTEYTILGDITYSNNIVYAATGA